MPQPGSFALTTIVPERRLARALMEKRFDGIPSTAQGRCGTAGVTPTRLGGVGVGMGDAAGGSTDSMTTAWRCSASLPPLQWTMWPV